MLLESQMHHIDCKHSSKAATDIVEDAAAVHNGDWRHVREAEPSVDSSRDAYMGSCAGSARVALSLLINQRSKLHSVPD